MGAQRPCATRQHRTCEAGLVEAEEASLALGQLGSWWLGRRAELAGTRRRQIRSADVIASGPLRKQCAQNADLHVHTLGAPPLHG